eukprot:TCONS_00072530-protein
MHLNCYVCGSTLAKQCTGCHTISYCGKDCQKKDWPFHKNSCKSRGVNVIDLLIKEGAYDFLVIVKKIFHYLSGIDLHYVRCVKRSWRDFIQLMWQSESDRDLFEAKLEEQWLLEFPRPRMIYEGFGNSAEKMKHSDQELFLSCVNESGILVLDMDEMYKVTYISRWQTKVKYTIPVEKPFNIKSIWDVHKDFVMVSDKAGIKCWNRKTHKEMKIHDQSNSLQAGIGLTRRFAGRGKKRKDVAQKIFIFGDIVIVVYISGLFLKFLATTTPLGPGKDQRNTVTFHLMHRFEKLLGQSPDISDHIQISHNPKEGYPEGRSLIYSKFYHNNGGDPEGGTIWCLEDDECLHEIHDIDNIHSVICVNGDEYVMASGVLSFGDTYLDFRRNGEMVRDMLVGGGLRDVQMNKYCIAILSNPGFRKVMLLQLYRFEDFCEGYSIDLKPTLTREFDVPIFTLYMTKNQVMWSRPDFSYYEDEKDRKDDSKHVVMSLNFWYAPYTGRGCL